MRKAIMAEMMAALIAMALIPAGAFAQQQKPAQRWQCRDLASTGNFLAPDETYKDGMACKQVVIPVAQPKPAVSQLPPPDMETLPDGTAVPLRFSETVSSATASKGDSVAFEVMDDVSLGGRIVIPKGSTAMGIVASARAKRDMGRAGKLDIALQYVRAAGGEKLSLRGTKEGNGDNHAGRMTAGIAVTSLVFFPAAPFFLMMHGKDIAIPQGTPVNAFTNGDATVNVNAGAPAELAAR